MPTKTRFWLAVAVQLLVLAGMVGLHGFTVATGRAVLLKTAPIDPWDPLRGRYVQLNYEISQPTSDRVAITGGPYKRGQLVWVTLKKGNPYWKAMAVTIRRPRVGDDEMAAKAKVMWYDPGSAADGTGRTQSQPARVSLRYGIEQFYLPEGQGKGIEGQASSLTVEALVDHFGRAALRQVFLDGKPLEWR
ncbi:MAG TPA: GDYXXLXY domain-containing protein [Bacillota bacterium]|jgi:uncharacterized membrane-anchored protein